MHQFLSRYKVLRVIIV